MDKPTQFAPKALPRLGNASRARSFGSLLLSRSIHLTNSESKTGSKSYCLFVRAQVAILGFFLKYERGKSFISRSNPAWSMVLSLWWYFLSAPPPLTDVDAQLVFSASRFSILWIGPTFLKGVYFFLWSFSYSIKFNEISHPCWWTIMSHQELPLEI